MSMKAHCFLNQLTDKLTRETIMTLLIITAITIFVLIIIVTMLPSKTSIARKSTIDATPAELFQLLSSTQGFQQFNPYKDDDPQLKITPFGPKTGIGAGFAFVGKEGKGTQTITALKENESITMQIDLGFMGQPLQHFSLDSAASGTEVTWQVDIDFGWNPMGRIFGLFADKVLGSVYVRGLENLGRVAVAN